MLLLILRLLHEEMNEGRISKREYETAVKKIVKQKISVK